MGGPLVNVTKDGNTVAVPADEEGPLLQRGYVEETPEQHAARVQADIDASNDPGALSAGVMAGLSGLTLGGTDALIAAEGGQSQLHDLYADHPIARTAGNIIGGIAPAALGDVAGVGDLLARTPAGFTMGIGSKIADALGGGALGMTAAGAFEGAANNAGGYVSDVALGDRDLSAEGFLGAMGSGALYGGVAAGALAMGSHGLIAARRLLPEAALTPEAVAEAQTQATNAIRDSVDTSTRLSRKAQDAVANTNREAEQLVQDLEQERANAIGEHAQQAAQEVSQPTAPVNENATAPTTETPTVDPAAQRAQIRADIQAGNVPGEVGPFTPEGMDMAVDREVARRNGMEPPQATKPARQLLADWRAKYPAGAVDYDAANAAARKGRLAEWAKNFVPHSAEDETIKAYFSNPMDPERTLERIGGTDVPQSVKTAANKAAGEASHEAYHAALANATNVSQSGTELMARSIYASRKAAAQALDDVYTAYRAGLPIADIRSAAAARLTDQLHELAAAREDMIQSLAQKPAVADQLSAQLTGATQGQTLGEKILSGAQKPVDPDEVIAKALDKSKDVNEDIAELAPKITRYEAAKASITESLADQAPPDAVAHAQAFRAAQDAAQTATARNTAETAESLDKLQRGVPAKKVAGGGKSILGKLSNAGQAYELLRDIGVPLPDPKSVPVIGPLLSLYLKAKVWSRLLRGGGGSFAATAEGTIAAKAAATRQRILGAVDTMLGAGAKVTAKAAEVAGPMALAHKLFDDGQKQQPYSSQPGSGTLEDNYQARLAELTAAMKPGAIDDAIKSRIHTSDPTIVDSIIAAEQRKLGYLYATAPKPDAVALPGQPQRLPSKAEITDWSHVVAAANDPAAVFERVAAGGRARPSEIDCLNNCAPKMMAEAQMHAVKQMVKMTKPLAYNRRIAVSMLTGIPMDSTMMPDHAAFLQSGFAPSPPPAPMPMPHSTLSGNISLGQQSLTRLDK